MDNRLKRFVRRVNETDALDTMLRYRSGQINEMALCAVCWPYIGRVADEVAIRFSNEGVCRDDLQSELWLVFVAKIVRTYNERSGPLTPYMLRYATNICRNMARQGNRVDYYDHNEVIERFGDSINHSFVMNADDELDRKKASAEIAKRLAIHDPTGYDALMNKKNLVPGYTPPPILPNEKKKARPVPEKKHRASEPSGNCKPVHRELRDIRNELGYSQAMMADVLGIGVPRYASYEYGRTIGIPDEIMDAARNELNLDKGEVSQLKARFGFPMGEIVRRWISMSGNDCDYKKLSAIVGVSLSTVHRWAENKTRPSLAMLNRYENMVVEWVGIMHRNTP